MSAVAPEVKVESITQATPRPVAGLSEREVGALQLWMKNVDEKLNTLLEAMLGNGADKLGMREKLSKLEERVADLEEWQRSANSTVKYFAVAFFLFCAGVGWGLLTNKIEILFK